MIELKNVTKKYATRFGAKTVLDDVSLIINKGEHIGILGRNGSGKSTLIRIIGDSEKPTSGYVTRSMKVSWPIGITGGLQGSLSGIDNLKFICRIYSKDLREARGFIEDFTELGKYLLEPVSTYSSGMKTKLALALSLILDFDCYLIDEALSVNDKHFREKYNSQFDQVRKEKSLVLVTHNEKQIYDDCDRVYVLNAGRLLSFEDKADALKFYFELKKSGQFDFQA